MAEAILVSKDIEAGRELIDILDKSQFPVTAAAWVYYPDLEDWRLVIGSPRAVKDLQRAYMDIALHMDEAGDLRERLGLARIKLVPPTDALLRALGQVIRLPGLGAVRFSKNMINGVFIDDALIYRLAA